MSSKEFLRATTRLSEEVSGRSISPDRCWSCDDKQASALDCGHYFCTSCLIGQHVEGVTDRCEQPCQVCFSITVPKRSLLLSSNSSLVKDVRRAARKLVTGKRRSDPYPVYISYERTRELSTTKIEFAVKTAVKAIKQCKTPQAQAKYIAESFEAMSKLWGSGWSCIIRQADYDEPVVMSSGRIESSVIGLRIAEYNIDIWRELHLDLGTIVILGALVLGLLYWLR